VTSDIYELSQTFYFEAAHSLERMIDAEPSRRIHGHTYHAEVVLAGPLSPESGMVIDLGFFRKEIERVRAMLDHRFLDEVPGIGPATLENLCSYLVDQFKDALPQLSHVAIERPASGDKCLLRRTRPSTVP
jgi:6-pyruvoyltetrahydropterin/6-carboxytetrahydropterin synthase